MDMNFQTVFSNAVEGETTFDTIFGAEEDDELIANVLGESGDEEDMDTLDTGITAGELEKELDNGESEAPKVDPSDEVETPDKTDSEKDTPGENIACPCAGVEDAVEKKEPEDDNLEDEIDKAEKKSDIDDLEEAFDFDDILGEECEDSECDDDDSDELTDNDDEVEIAADPGVDVEVDDDDDDDDLDDLDDACNKIRNDIKKENDDQENKVNDYDTSAPSTNISGQEESSIDNIDFDKILGESTDDDMSEKVEDEIIDTVADDSELSDAELAALDTEDDDDIIDEILGED